MSQQGQTYELCGNGTRMIADAGLSKSVLNFCWIKRLNL